MQLVDPIAVGVVTISRSHLMQFFDSLFLNIGRGLDCPRRVVSNVD